MTAAKSADTTTSSPSDDTPAGATPEEHKLPASSGTGLLTSQFGGNPDAKSK